MRSREADRSLRAVQVIWVTWTVLMIALFVASLPPHFRQLQTLSYPDITEPASVRLGLAQLGFSTSSYARAIVAIKSMLGVGFFSIAFIIALNRLDSPFALFVSMSLVLFGSTFTDTLPALVAEQPVWDVPVNLLSLVGFVSFFTLFFLFPNGRFVPAWTIVLVPLWLAEEWLNFFPVESSIVNNATFAVFFGLIAAGIGSQVYRYRRVSSPTERQQTKWIVLGLVASVLAFLAFELTGGLFPTGKAYVLHELIGGALMSAVFVLLPFAIAIAILRHRLWGIDRLLNRTLVFVLLSGAGIGIYLAALAGIGALVGEGDSPLIGTIAVGIAAVLMQPLYRRVQRGVNRLLYGERDDPYAVLSRLGARLEETRTAETLLNMVPTTIADALKLPYVALALTQDDHATIVASSGTAGPNVTVLPLIHHGQQVGELRLAPRAPGERFDRMDQRLLADLARQLGLVAHTYQLQAIAQHLATDLQQSRERIVTLREEERRHLRRDLHDGLGPRLAGLSLSLDAARNSLWLHPETADALLDELTTETQSIMADIRRLAYSLRPPALDDFGLIGALDQCAMSYNQDETAISIVAPRDLPPLPAAVEVAIYYITREAIINVARHAGPCTCQVAISVVVGDAAICCDICDDGQGFPPDQPAGIGQVSMRERAAELNGTLTITSTPGVGTVVHARIPCSLAMNTSGRSAISMPADHITASKQESYSNG